MENKTKLRLAVYDDIDPILAITKIYKFDNILTYPSILEQVKNNHIIVAIRNHRIVGFISFYLKQTSFIQIVALCVHPEFTQRGIGNELLRLIEKGAIDNKNKGLNVEIPDNDPNTFDFFTKRGYFIRGVLKEYYNGQRTAIRLGKRLFSHKVRTPFNIRKRLEKLQSDQPINYEDLNQDMEETK